MVGGSRLVISLVRSDCPTCAGVCALLGFALSPVWAGAESRSKTTLSLFGKRCLNALLVFL